MSVIEESGSNANCQQRQCSHGQPYEYMEQPSGDARKLSQFHWETICQADDPDQREAARQP